MARRSFRLRSVLIVVLLLMGCGESAAPVAPIGGGDEGDAGMDAGTQPSADAGADDLPGSTSGDGTGSGDGSGGGGGDGEAAQDGAGGGDGTGGDGTADGSAADGFEGVVDAGTGGDPIDAGSGDPDPTDPACGGTDGPTTVSAPNCDPGALITLTGTVYDFKARTTKATGGTVASSECGTTATVSNNGAFTIQVPSSAAFYLRITPKASDTAHVATLTGYLSLDAPNDTPLNVFLVPTTAVTASRAECSVEPLVLFGGVRNSGSTEPQLTFSGSVPTTGVTASVAYLAANLTRQASASTTDSTGYALYEGLVAGPDNLFFTIDDPTCNHTAGQSEEKSVEFTFVPFERGHVTAQLVYYNCP